MHTSSMWPPVAGPAWARRAASITSVVSLLALTVGMAAPAGAGAQVASSVTSPMTVSALPQGEVEEVLAGIPLKDLSAAQLSEALAGLPGLEALPGGKLREALTSTIEGLAAEGGTLGQLAGSPELLSGLEGNLKSLLSIGELLSLSELLSLKGESLSSVLEGGLGSVEATQIVSRLLGSSTEPEQLIGQVLASNPEQVQTLLGSTLSEEPFSEGTEEELAGDIGMTAGGLAEALGTTLSQLPATAMALTAPLTSGETLSVLNAVEGLDLGLLSPSPEGGGGGGEGGSGGSGGGSGGSGGGSGGTGGTGGTGGAGSASGTPTGTTLVVNNLAAPGTTAHSANAGRRSAKIKLLRRRHRGHWVTLVVRVPGAGTLSVAGRGVRHVRRQTARAERVRLRTRLTRAGTASLRRHHHRLRVRLVIAFKRVGGGRSSTRTSVTFHLR